MIHYAQRAGERRTPLQLRGTLESYASLLQEAAYTSLQTEWPETTRACLVGLFEEWIGDVHLLTGDENATEYYDRAEPWYRIEEDRATDDISVHRPCWGWGAEPQFEASTFVFFDWLEYEHPEYVEQFRDLGDDANVFERLDRKRSLVEELDAPSNT